MSVTDRGTLSTNWMKSRRSAGVSSPRLNGGGKKQKKAADKSLKEKRLAKQAKRSARSPKGNKSVEDTFDH